MFWLARCAKYLAKATSGMAQAGCQGRQPEMWISKKQTPPGLCKAFLGRWRMMASDLDRWSWRNYNQVKEIQHALNQLVQEVAELRAKDQAETLETKGQRPS